MRAGNPAVSGAADLPCRSGPGCLPLASDFVRGTPMLDAAVKALSQMMSPPMRSILWRSIGVALVLIIVLAIGLQRLLSWFATYGEGWLEGLLGPGRAPSPQGLSLVIFYH